MMSVGRGARMLDLDWCNIDYVLMDMDGTLLDKYFDDYFWETYVPKAYAKRYGISWEDARAILLEKYKSQEGSLNWTDLDYWSEVLSLDILQLKDQISYLIKMHPYVPDFLEFLREENKKSFLVTNAHPKTIELKLKKLGISCYFTEILSAFDAGFPKSSERFWEKAEDYLGFLKNKTLFIDDEESALEVASRYGIRYLLHKVNPGLKKVADPSKFPRIASFKELLPSD